MYALSVHNMTFGYDAALPVLRGVTLHVARGEILSIVGPNGSGKSTLLRCLDRLLIPQQGEIRLGERTLSSVPRREIARRMAFVPQDTGLLFPFTVEEVILMGRAPHTRGAVSANRHRLFAQSIPMDTKPTRRLSDRTGCPLRDKSIDFICHEQVANVHCRVYRKNDPS